MITYRKDFHLWWPDYDHNPVACHAKLMRRSKDARLLMSYCRNFRTVVQAGGHVGVWPRILTEKFAHVLTFEPDPYLNQCLVRNLAKHKSSYLLISNAALGDTVGKTKMHQHPSAGSWRVGDGGEVEVRQTTIDHIVAGEPCDAIVLDIEGSELNALRGAAQTIERDHPIIMVEGLPRKTPDVHAHLIDLGYKVLREVHADTIYGVRHER